MRNHRNDELNEIENTYTRLGYTSGHGDKHMVQLLRGMSLATLLGAGALFAQQAATGSQQTPVHTKAAAKRSAPGKSHPRSEKSESAPSQFPVQVITGGEVRTVMFDAYRPRNAAHGTKPGETSVEVMNGPTLRKQVFHEKGSTKAAARTNLRKSRTRQAVTEAPPETRVEEINGANTSVRTFSRNSGEASEAGTQPRRPRPVVIGVATSRAQSRVVALGGNTQPVVVGVSSESENRNAAPVVVGVASNGVASDRPVQGTDTPRISKRRPYVPNPTSR